MSQAQAKGEPEPLVLRGINSSTWNEGLLTLKLGRFEEPKGEFPTEVEYRTVSSETLFMLANALPILAMERTGSVGRQTPALLRPKSETPTDWMEPNAVGTLGIKPLRATPSLYPFDRYTFAFAPEMLSQFSNHDISKYGLPPRDAGVRSEDISELLYEIDRPTFGPNVPKEAAKAMSDEKRTGYKHVVYPLKVKVELPEGLFFSDPPDLLSEPHVNSLTFTVERKRGLSYLTFALLGAMLLFMIWLARVSSLRTLAIEMVGYLASLIALRGLLLDKAPVFPTIIDYAIFVSVLVAILTLVVRFRSSAGEHG